MRKTGLGLPICKRIVEEHHGTLQIASEIDIGTCVRIALPATPLAAGPRGIDAQ